MSMVELSQRERGLYDFVKGYIAENGYGPSHAEISEATGIGATSVNYHLGRLRTKGLLTWQKGYARTLSLVDR